MSIAFGPELFSRYMAVDITTTIILDTIAIMLPYPKKNNDAAALFYAFDNVVNIEPAFENLIKSSTELLSFVVFTDLVLNSVDDSECYYCSLGDRTSAKQRRA